jgi:hypothetical protein
MLKVAKPRSFSRLSGTENVPLWLIVEEPEGPAEKNYLALLAYHSLAHEFARDHQYPVERLSKRTAVPDQLRYWSFSTKRFRS